MALDAYATGYIQRSKASDFLSYLQENSGFVDVKVHPYVGLAYPFENKRRPPTPIA